MEGFSEETFSHIEDDSIQLIESVLYNTSRNNSLINMTYDEETLIEEYLGVRYMDNWTLAVLNLIYGSIFISGIIGNVCTCVVIAKNRYMHTATNYYLFSLAVSDVLILLLGKKVLYYRSFNSIHLQFVRCYGVQLYSYYYFGIYKAIYILYCLSCIQLNNSISRYLKCAL